MSNRLFVFPIQITSQQVCTIERNSMLLNDPLLLQARNGIPTINCWSKHLGPWGIQQIYWKVVGKCLSHDSFSISDLKCDPKPIRIQPISQNYIKVSQANSRISNSIFFHLWTFPSQIAASYWKTILHRHQHQNKSFSKRSRGHWYYQLPTTKTSICFEEVPQIYDICILWSTRNHGWLGSFPHVPPTIQATENGGPGCESTLRNPTFMNTAFMTKNLRHVDPARWNFDVVGFSRTNS